MAHVMILGQTLSGKTTAAKQIAESYLSKGVGVLVYDPLNDPGWPCSFKSADFHAFMDVYHDSRGCAIFFDEAGECCEEHTHEMIKTATRGRHFGHRCHYIAQRATLIKRTIRDQCSSIFLFNSGLEDCKIHAAEWNEAAFREKGPFLETGEYFYKQRMKPLKHSRLF